MKKLMTLLIVAWLLGLCSSAVHAKTAPELFREGLYAEEVEANLDAALGIYQQIVLDTTAPRNLRARALHRQGMILLKQRKDAEARVVLEQLVAEYADQTEVVAEAKPMLEELGNADPASLMPPETVVYVEIGSPGRQIETVVNMLKGTPVENALAGLTHTDNFPAGPAAMMRGLLTPAMLGELKKIRGLGIGLTDLTGKVPTGVIVLFPGQSEALKIPLQMVMAAAGKGATSVEGMQMVTLPQGAAAAFDDTVVIAVTPSPKGTEMLQQAIRQYKGKAGAASLASRNQAFMNVSKQARQQNALTVWVNVDETYGRVTKMLPPDQLPPQLHMANTIVDFQNVDDLIASLSLRETGIALDANLNFKDGGKSMFYNLIRTPNLSKDALQAVPADAVALLTFTLGGANTAQAQVAGQKLNEAVGQDIASQIFGNVEQITLFAAPPREVVAVSDSPIPAAAQAFGVAITSKNPPQIHQLLLGLLQKANALPAGTEAPTIPASGRFDLTLAHGMKFFGYTDQANRTLILAPNAQMIEGSINAIRQDSSVVSGGKLQDALATLSPQTSKLLLANVAGVLQLASEGMEFPSDEAADEARQSIVKLIEAMQQTTVRVQTTEQDNSFSLRLSVSDLPPISEIAGPLAHLGQMMQDAKAHMAAGKVQEAKAACIAQASRAPAIDGQADEIWAGAPSYSLGNIAYSPISGEADLSARFKAMYDSQALYVLVDVTDDELLNDSVEFWLDDGVELFIDADNSKDQTFGENDYQYYVSWDSAAPQMGETKHDRTAGVQQAVARTDGGYRVEIRLPWSTLGVASRVGSRIGLDVHVNDDDDGGDRDTKLMWNTAYDIAWQHPRAFGTGDLAGLVARWKLDESDGRQAADSSGNGHQATVQGNPDWQPNGGRLGGAIALGGDGDFLDVADESAFDFTGGLTVAAWIRANTLDRPWQAIVTKGDSAWRMQRNAESSVLEFACTGLRIPGGNDYGSLFGAREISLNEWHHVVGVYDGRKMSLYVDGVLDASQEAWGSVNTNDVPVQIGASTEMGDRFWNGLIDDVRLYNFGLSEAQVQQVYREGR